MLLICRRPVILTASIFSTLLLPVLAQAHPDHGMLATGSSGFFHPLTGMDHLLAMLAVGVWAGRSGKPAVWMLPCVFLVAMVGGAVAAALGVALPAVEPTIAISVIVLGMLVATGLRIPAPLSAALVAVFAIFHG